jgi:ribokinase
MNITTIGGATVDIIVSGSHRANVHGAKQEVEDIGFYMGGGAVNAGLGFVASGAQVHTLCALGADAEGAWFREALARAGIGLDGVQTVAHTPTGKAVVHLDADGEASVFAQRGASAALSVYAAPARLLAPDVVYVSALPETAMAQLADVLKKTRQHATRLVLNPGARQLAASATALSSLLDMADLVCVNRHEAHLLARLPEKARPCELTSEDIRHVLSKIGQRTHASVVMTLGAMGAVFANGGEIHFFPAPVTRVVSTLGAGDAFASTFAFHWLSGQSAHHALTSATRHAGAVLSVAAANLAGPLLAGTAT